MSSAGHGSQDFERTQQHTVAPMSGVAEAASRGASVSWLAAASTVSGIRGADLPGDKQLLGF
jgi:hypothetical protein